MRLTCVFFITVLFFATPAMAKTYYVSVSGNDASPGTQESPWANPQKCVDPGSPLKAGDICELANGYYTSTVSGRVVFAGAAAPQGRPGMPITIRASNPGGAKIQVPNSWPGVDCRAQQCNFAAFYIMQPYYVIEGIDIAGGVSLLDPSATVTGIVLAPAHGSIIRRNDIHNIARDLCHDGLDSNGNGNQAILLLNSANVTVEKNRFYTIGRKRNGETGCVTGIKNDDHGINAVATTRLMVRYNIFWDTDRGAVINVKAGLGQTAGIKIYNNTIVGGGLPTHQTEQIRFSNILQDAQIINNIFYNPPDGYAIGWAASTRIVDPPGVLVAHNLTNSIRDDTHFTSPENRPLSGIMYKENISGSNPTFVDTTINEFRLRSGSRAIDNGMRISGTVVSDNSPDIGAYTFGTKEPLGTGTSGVQSGANLGLGRPRGCI